MRMGKDKNAAINTLRVGIESMKLALARGCDTWTKEQFEADIPEYEEALHILEYHDSHQKLPLIKKIYRYLTFADM